MHPIHNLHCAKTTSSKPVSWSFVIIWMTFSSDKRVVDVSSFDTSSSSCKRSSCEIFEHSKAQCLSPHMNIQNVSSKNIIPGRGRDQGRPSPSPKMGNTLRVFDLLFFLQGPAVATRKGYSLIGPRPASRPWDVWLDVAVKPPHPLGNLVSPGKMWQSRLCNRPLRQWGAGKRPVSKRPQPPFLVLILGCDLAGGWSWCKNRYQIVLYLTV